MSICSLNLINKKESRLENKFKQVEFKTNIYTKDASRQTHGSWMNERLRNN